MSTVVVLVISPDSVRESVEREICTERGSNNEALQVLRKMRQSSELTSHEQHCLEHIEHGADQSSRLLFHTLSASLESRKLHLDHDCIHCGLCKHQDKTIEKVADLLFKDDAASLAELRRKVHAGGSEREDAVASISAKLLELSTDAKTLSDVTDILTLDAKNSGLRKFYETAVEYMGQLKDFAAKLLRDIVRLREAGEYVPMVDTLGSHSRTGYGFNGELKESDGADPPKRGGKHTPEEEAGRVIQHSAVDKRIAELRKKLERLTEELLHHHRLAVEGPAELREAAAVSRNQDQVDAGKVEAELKDAESDQQWFDA